MAEAGLGPTALLRCGARAKVKLARYSGYSPNIPTPTVATAETGWPQRPAGPATATARLQRPAVDGAGRTRTDNGGSPRTSGPAASRPGPDAPAGPCRHVREAGRPGYWNWIGPARADRAEGCDSEGLGSNAAAAADPDSRGRREVRGPAGGPPHAIVVGITGSRGVLGTRQRCDAARVTRRATRPCRTVFLPSGGPAPPSPRGCCGARSPDRFKIEAGAENRPKPAFESESESRFPQVTPAAQPPRRRRRRRC